jgi:hypothetical protein
VEKAAAVSAAQTRRTHARLLRGGAREGALPRDARVHRLCGMEHLNPPPGTLPRFLHGLRLPATVDEALVYAEAHGASDAALAFLEALPAAVFTSDAGLHHALSELGPDGDPHAEVRGTSEAHDGVSG